MSALPALKYGYNHLRYLLNFPLRRRNARYQKSGAPDGMPLPPPKLAFMVRWLYDLEDHIRSGTEGFSCIKNFLSRSGFDLRKFEKVLDFGCGCGRVLRHWPRVTGQQLHGSDYNPQLIDWCRQAFPHVSFSVNGLNAKLDYSSEFFDFIYASSVFSHFDESLQDAWVKELGRVLKPGGLLLITVMGSTRLGQLTPEQLSQYHSGNLVVKYSRHVGTNVCGAYHPKAYVQNHLAKGWTLVADEPGGAKDQGQDFYLLQKR